MNISNWRKYLLIENLRKLFLWVGFVAIFIAGLIVVMKGNIQFFPKGDEEGLDGTPAGGPSSPDCYDLLLKSGDNYLLYNTKHPNKEGVNPLSFPTIEAYQKYMDEYNRHHPVCPILYLQKGYDAQNNAILKMYSNPQYIEGGLPALPVEIYDASNNPPLPLIDATTDNGYNKNMYPGYDPMGLQVGRFTTIDQIHHSTNKSDGSLNPADSNWMGVIESQKAVDVGLFKENEVYKVSHPQPHT